MGIVLRTALMYLVVLILLRITTRRIMRSATPLDMVVIFFFGGVATPPILGDDRSITGALVAACTLAGLHTLLSYLKRVWPVIGMITEGNPVVVFSNTVTGPPKVLIQDAPECEVCLCSISMEKLS